MATSGAPPRLASLRFRDDSGDDALSDAATATREEILELAIATDAGGHALEAALVRQLLAEFGCCRLDPATVSVQVRGKSDGWSRWRSAADLQEQSTEEQGTEARLQVHAPGSTGALRARGHWEAGTAQLAAAAAALPPLKPEPESAGAAAATQVAQFLRSLGGGASEETEPEAWESLARGCCDALTEFGTEPARWYETLSTMPVETLVAFVTSVQEHEDTKKRECAEEAEWERDHMVCGQGYAVTAPAGATGGWTMGGCATTSSTLVPCRLRLRLLRRALEVTPACGTPEPEPEPEQPQADRLDGCWCGWRPISELPALGGGGGGSQAVLTLPLSRVLFCCVLEDRPLLPPPMECRMPSMGMDAEGGEQQRWACLPAACQAAARAGEWGLIEHLPCCTAERCHLLCPLADVDQRSGSSTALHTLHLVLAAAESHADDGRGGDEEEAGSIECTLLVSSGGGLALAEALQAAVREERDRES